MPILLDFDAAEDEENLLEITDMMEGTNGCRGAMAIYHGEAGNSLSDAKIIVFQPGFFRFTRRVFRRREVSRVEVMGNCHWRLFPQTKFRGQIVPLNPGYNSFIDILPYSIAQRN